MDGCNRQARIRLHAAFSEEFRRIPLESSDGIIYLSVPLGYRLWTQKLSKLELAADMVRSVMTELVSCRQVILLCDSWYPRKPVTGLVDAFENLEIICCARSDTVLYAPPVKGQAGAAVPASMAGGCHYGKTRRRTLSYRMPRSHHKPVEGPYCLRLCDSS